MLMLTRYSIVCLLFVAANCIPAAAAGIFAGPVEAKVLRIIDGDTFVAEAQIWPGHIIRTSVRIRGIDAPEMRSRCETEKKAARRSRSALARLLGDGPVMISAVGSAKYYGRVLADVADGHGRPVASQMIGLGMARPYNGGRREAFC